MKRILALAVAAVFCLTVAALAGDEKMGEKKMGGTITKLDVENKTMTVKDKEDKEWEINWEDATKMEGGEPKEGEMVHFKATEKDGKLWASWIHVGEMKGMAKKKTKY